jgi:hypothetical protein
MKEEVGVFHRSTSIPQCHYYGNAPLATDGVRLREALRKGVGVLNVPACDEGLSKRYSGWPNLGAENVFPSTI